MDGYIQRTEPLSNYPLPVFGSQIGQGYIVAVKKGHAEIFIHQVERLSHALWKLEYKTEDTSVIALAHIEGLHGYAEFRRFRIAEADIQSVFSAPDPEVEHGIRRMEHQVDAVPHLRTVDRNKRVTPQKAGFGGQASRRNRFDTDTVI
jgi:hypothetical protein